MNTKVVYTCITGEYDAIPQYLYVANDWDYILFTDNTDLIKKGNIYHWQVKPLQFNELTNVKNARWHKINAHLLFPNYDYSVWLDGNISVENELPYRLFDKFINESVQVVIPIHPERKCIYDEAKIVVKLLIDHSTIVKQEMAFLKKEQYPKDNGLSETNIMLRKHNNADIVKVQNTWWAMLLQFSKRDQLACNYAFWKHNIKITPLYQEAGYHKNCDEFRFISSPNHKRYDNTIFKFFKKVRDGHKRHCYFCGFKIFSYKRV